MSVPPMAPGPAGPRGPTRGSSSRQKRASSTPDPPRAAVAAEDDDDPENPYNLNSASFNSELFTQTLLKEASLSQLMAQETDVVRQIGSLDSQMQTLVYENYNKFIAATDTIRKMRVDFRAMEDEMDQLADRMRHIGAFSRQIGDALGDNRRQIGQLSSTHALLKKLQFLFELPAKLNECLERDDDEGLGLGVRYYGRAQRVLDQYEHMPSFKGIKADCDRIMVQLKQRLLSRLADREATPEQLSASVDLLLQLNEPPDALCDAYLTTAGGKLEDALGQLEHQVRLASGDKAEAAPTDRPSDAFESVMDVLEFVDHGCHTFVSDLCLVMAAFNDTFLQRQSEGAMAAAPSCVVVDEKMATDKLTSFVQSRLNVFLDLLRSRLKLETKLDDVTLRVRALDRFYRRLQAMCRLLPGIDFSRAGLDLVLEAAQLHCHHTLEHLKRRWQENLMNARQTLVAPPSKRLTVASSDAAENETDLSELNTNLLTVVADEIRTHSSTLQLFIDPELTFAVKTYFRAQFCRRYVREGVLVAFFDHLVDVAEQFCAHTEKTTPPVLLLLLSRTSFDLQLSTTQYVMALIDEQFFIDDCSGGLTTVGRVNERFRAASQLLLNHYVKLQGGVLSQMLRKSVETRDWLNTVEPRTVRAVMKRVVEETTMIDRQVGRVYEEGLRTARSSDSSRRTRLGHSRTRSAGGGGAWNSQLDTSLASNIQKMFNERIEIFSPVDFSRVSILTGIVKIALKTLLECVRLRSFSRFGFQQIQVDAHYLHLYLWRFVSDENLVTFLLDEIMTSAVHRCPDPVPMDNSVVDVICDRG